MLAARRHFCRQAESTSNFTPSVSSTSAEPALLLADRLPCLTTFTPAAATIIAAAVEMLNVPRMSPPVPQVSRITSLEASQGTAIDLSRITPAVPTSSSTVVPFAASPISSPPICAFSCAAADNLQKCVGRFLTCEVFAPAEFEKDVTHKLK